MTQFCTIWGKGMLFAFSGLDGKTNQLHNLVLRAAGDAAHPELEIRQPETKAVIRYIGKDAGKVTFTGDFVQIGDSAVVFADAMNLLIVGDFEYTHDRTLLRTLTKGNRTIVGVRGFWKPELIDADEKELIAQRSRFLEMNLPKLPAALSETSRRAATKALSQLKTQIYSPEGQVKQLWSTPDRWPHREMWIWDSVFHAIGMRRFAPEVAWEMLASVFDGQDENGFIPHMISPYSGSVVTQPPVLGLGMSLVNEVLPSPSWIKILAPKLGKFLRWLMANRDRDGGGLLEWFLEENDSCHCGESGMDNSPRFDAGQYLDATDFNAYLAHECELMAQFLPEEAEFWTGHYNRFCKLMNERLWNDELQLYVDYNIEEKHQQIVAASSGFMPLLCGAPTLAQAKAMAAQLHDPAKFGTPLPLPSLAVGSPLYMKDMWRGPVWININYMAALGLERYGLIEDAQYLRRKTAEAQERYFLQYGTFFEYYDDRLEVDPPNLLRKSVLEEGGEFDIYRHIIHDYGWSATLYLDLLFQLNR